MVGCRVTLQHPLDALPASSLVHEVRNLNSQGGKFNYSPLVQESSTESGKQEASGSASMGLQIMQDS